LANPKLTAAQKLAINYYKAKLNLLNVVAPSVAAHEAFNLFTKPYGNPRKRKSKLLQQAEPLRLYSEGLKLTGYRWRAHPTNDLKVLIIHGFAGSVGAFDRYIGPLQKLGYDVFAYDAPGHGGSAGSRLNAGLYSQMINDVVKAHGPFDAFLAHSLGGLSLMLSLHQLQPSHDTRVVLIAPATESTTAANQFFQFLNLPSTLRRSFDAHIEKISGKPLEWWSVSRVLPEVKASILWVHDKNDDTTPFGDVYPLIQQQPPHVHFYITEGLGHSAIYKDNKVKKKILEFLAPATGSSKRF
jgi:pimeloyl-ACP methyl ester carboxylesterase